MNKAPKKLYFYIIKNFLIKLFFVIAAISLLIFIVNLFDVIDKVRSTKNDGWVISTEIAALQIPGMLEDISIFLIMLGAMITMFSFSSRSEITIMRSAGLSLWKITFPLIVTSFCLGICLVVFLAHSQSQPIKNLVLWNRNL